MRALKDIRIGTMVRAGAPNVGATVRGLVKLGFESIEPFFWQTMEKDLTALSHELKEAIGGADVVIDTLGMFGNPLEGGELDKKTLAGWEALIDHAHLFGARTIAGFTGRVRGKPIEASLPRYVEVFGELSKRAADKGVRIAFENCAMDGNWASGDWNIAHNPDAWELMFDALPRDNIGLEWEPCHQLVYLIDPIPQIRKWANKFFHVHGKDATVRWDIVKRAWRVRQISVRADAHAGLRRHRLDARHQRASPRRLQGYDRHRGLARSGLSRGARNDRPGSRAQISAGLPRRRTLRRNSTADFHSRTLRRRQPAWNIGQTQGRIPAMKSNWTLCARRDGGSGAVRRLSCRAR